MHYAMPFADLCMRYIREGHVLTAQIAQERAGEGWNRPKAKCRDALAKQPGN